MPLTHETLNPSAQIDFMMTLMLEFAINLLGYIAHKDNVNRKERQKQGIEKRKAEGKKLGRTKGSISKRIKEKELMIIDLLKKKVTWSNICKICNVSMCTIQNIKERNGLIYGIVQTKNTI
jgi:DNA invertase Pin-like site-specific DNA recombinase